MKRFLAFLGLLSASPFAWAAVGSIGSPQTGDTLTFTPPASDVSVQLLGQIFGTVADVLTGSGSPLAGELFGVLNNTALFLGGILIIYTVFISTLNTAYEGKMLGEKWHSIWVPIRSAFGIALMLPTASGYAVLQAFIMWAVLQGVGAADSLWNTALNYLEFQGGTVTTNPVDVETPASSLFVSQVCMYGMNKSAGTNYSVSSAYLYGNGKENPATQYVYYFGPKTTNSNGTVGAFCGYVGVNLTKDANVNAAAESSLDQMVSVTQGPAQQLVDNISTDGIYPSAISDAMNIYMSNVGQAMRQALQKYAIENTQQGKIYAYNMHQARRAGWIFAGRYYYTMNEFNDSITRSLECSVAKGANANRASRGSLNLHPDTKGGQNLASWFQMNRSPNSGKNHSLYASICNNQNTFSGQIPDFYLPSLNTVSAQETDTDYQSLQVYLKPMVRYIAQNQRVTARDIRGKDSGSLDNSGDAGNARIFINLTTDAVSQSMAYLRDMFQAVQAGADPVMAAQQYGKQQLNIVSEAWRKGSNFIFGVGVAAITMDLAAGVASSMPGFKRFVAPALKGMASALDTLITMLIAVMSWTMPLAIMVFGMLFVSGISLAVYVPLVPYILFTFGAIGWIVAVLEAMVAAPIVALGVLHPEGQHQLLGKAEPSVMLLANIFLRPSLMIFGMILGMTLSYVAVDLINMGFMGAATSIHPGAASLPSNGHDFWHNQVGDGLDLNFLESAVLMVIYSTMMVFALNKSFAMIHEIPDKVLRWIQGGEHTRGQIDTGEQEAREVKQKVDTTSEKGAQQAGTAMDSGIKGSVDAGHAPGKAVGQFGKGVMKTGKKPDKKEDDDPTAI